VTVAVEAARAEEARAAADVERHHHAVAGLQVLDRGANRVHRPDELMAERMSHPQVGHHAVIEMQIRAANRGAGHPEDCVVGVFD